MSITTTRLILLDGDAGQSVPVFGEFVIAGEVVIGMVVFLIIAVAQFLVITKDAERVMLELGNARLRGGDLQGAEQALRSVLAQQALVRPRPSNRRGFYLV